MFSTGKKNNIKKNMEMPGIEPGAFHMQSERSTTEPHPPVVMLLSSRRLLHHSEIETTIGWQFGY